VVVGGGIAGFSAALYTARQGLRTAVVSMGVGGRLAPFNNLPNCPIPISKLYLQPWNKRQLYPLNAHDQSLAVLR